MDNPGARRLARNLVIAACVGAGLAAVALVVGLDEPLFAASMATAYVGLALLGATLAPGPLNVLAGRPNPVSTHLRRDLGIWGGVVTLVHVGVGLQRHMGGRWRLYFFFPDMGGRLLGLRHDALGVASWVGLASTLLVVILLALSNDVSLRRLGTAGWKRIQRLNYLVLPTAVLHGLVFQVVIGERAWGWLAVTALVVAVAAALQALGWSRHSRAGASRRLRR